MAHKWAKKIKAWADGAEIEVRCQLINGWTSWMPVEATNPQWHEDNEYRIKPQPKEPQYLYVYKNKTRGIELGFKPHPAQNMWETEIIGKIKLEQDE